MTDNKILVNSEILFLDGDNFAEAAVGVNPYFQWAKIIITDDKPNINKQRVPPEEFDNVIRTGVFTPIKMSDSESKKGHKDAIGKALGTITQIMKTETNQLVAIAALWKKEREDDITKLKEMYSNGKPPQVSWELVYESSSEDAEGVSDLHNIALTGVAVVSDPAYGGRTPFVAMSSVENSEEIDVEELELAKTKIAELENQLSSLRSEKEASDAELITLREYHQTAEKQKADAERIGAIRKRFTDANVKKADNYFDENRDKLLGLTDEMIDFMLQELVSFSATASTDEKKNPEVPPIVGNGKSKLSPKELGKVLHETHK